MAEPRIAAVLKQIRGEYVEHPGLRLTAEEAQQLWKLDPTACAALFDVLVDVNFLVRTKDGSFVRAADGFPTRPVDH